MKKEYLRPGPKGFDSIDLDSFMENGLGEKGLRKVKARAAISCAAAGFPGEEPSRELLLIHWIFEERCQLYKTISKLEERISELERDPRLHFTLALAAPPA